MNLSEMKKLFALASSGEVQGLVAKFAASMDEINTDRAALKQAFPAGWKYFDERCTRLETKLDAVLSILARMVAPEQPEQIEHVGNRNTNGAARDHGDASDTAT